MIETPPWSARNLAMGHLQRTGMGGVRVSAGGNTVQRGRGSGYVCMYVPFLEEFIYMPIACSLQPPDFQMSEHDGGEQEREE